MAAKLFQYAENGNVEGLRECISSSRIDVDHSNKNGDTALHLVCQKGYTDCARILVAAGASVDPKNSSGQTPVHLALLAKHSNVALLLLQSGADVDLQNASGDSPIHLAAREGLVDVTQTLCAFGCSLDLPNGQGLYPLHLAARNGHIEVVRCLCLSGSNVEQRNSDGIKAEIMAFKRCHYDVGELLNKLRITSLRESYMNQLVPTDKPLPRFNIKFLGPSGSGKTTLIRSLKAGYFISLFSRSKSQSYGSYNSSMVKSSPSSPTKTQIEMDVTSRQMTSNELPHYQYTRGIEVHQASFSSCDVTLWDFSGLDTYYPIYDFFLGDPYSFYVIVFNLRDSPCTQHYQCSFWLTFLQARLHTPETLSKNGIRVLLVGTHADVSRTHRDAQGVFISSLAQELRDRLAGEFPGFTFDKKVVLCDAHLPNSQGLRDIKNSIAKRKLTILQAVVLRSTGFLETTVNWLQTWRKEYELFPVIQWSTFVERIHRNVNPLAGTVHISELINQLTIMGDVLCLKSNMEDLIVLNLGWLCGEVIGGLLSLEAIARARLTGCYTEDDFQSCFPHGPADKTLALLTALQLCTQCENDGEIEYEFPCYNLVERLEGLWAAADERYSPPNSCYGGVRLKAPYRLLQTIFTRLQVQLRRATNLCQDPDSDLYQWFRGSKLCSGDIEGLITLEQDGQVIDVKVRGTHSLRLACFYFMEEILSIIDQVLLCMSPGVPCERHILSSEELRLHGDTPHCWRPEHILATLLSPSGLNTNLHNPNINQDETLLQLIGFGAEAIPEVVVLGGDLPISELSGYCQTSLAQLLDPPDPLGKDWCLLAVKLDMGHKIASLDNSFNLSKTLALLDLWGKSKEATIGNLIKKLVDFGREDAAEVLMQSAPLYRVTATPNFEMVQTPTSGYFSTGSNMSR